LKGPAEKRKGGAAKGAKIAKDGKQGEGIQKPKTKLNLKAPSRKGTKALTRTESASTSDLRLRGFAPLR
jgi:hypothetical protein